MTCLLAYSATSSESRAAEPSIGQDQRPAQAGTFGEDDPFTVPNAPLASARPDDVPSPNFVNELNAQASVFLNNDSLRINDGSRINPGNQVANLKKNTAFLEARTTLSRRFDEHPDLRWLFKGYASTEKAVPDDGVPNKHVRFDEFFVDWKTRDLFASIGKRRVNWGHAQGFNPVNVVAPPRDPLNPDYQTEGQPMIWLSRMGATTMDAIFTRNYDASYSSDQNRWGLRWSIPKPESDYAVYYFDGMRYGDGRKYERMLGGSFSANIVPGITLYVEAANFSRNYRNYYNASGVVERRGGSYTQAVVGSLIDLGAKSSVFVEYLYNGQGYTRDQRRSYLQAADIRLAANEDHAIVADFIPLSMNRHYVLTGYRKEYRERYALSLSVLAAADRSSSTRIEGRYAFSDYYEAKVSYLHNAGGRDSEFGNSPYRSLLEVQFIANF